MKEFIRIGFWYSKYEPHLPHPEDFVSVTWNEEERNLVIDYLKKGNHIEYYKGFSTCRFCNCINGTSDQSDSVYIWPEGYVHYLEHHHVKPDESFIKHIKGR